MDGLVKEITPDSLFHYELLHDDGREKDNGYHIYNPNIIPPPFGFSEGDIETIEKPTAICKPDSP